MGNASECDVSPKDKCNICIHIQESMVILYLDLYCLLGSVVEVIRIYHCNFCLSSILSSTFTNSRLKEFSISCGE